MNTNTDPRLAAIRACPYVGDTSMSSMAEAHDDAEILAMLDEAGITGTGPKAVRKALLWAWKTESAWLEAELNALCPVDCKDLWLDTKARIAALDKARRECKVADFVAPAEPAKKAPKTAKKAAPKPSKKFQAAMNSLL